MDPETVKAKRLMMERLKKHLTVMKRHLEVVRGTQELLRNHPSVQEHRRDDDLVEAVWFLLNFVDAFAVVMNGEETP